MFESISCTTVLSRTGASIESFTFLHVPVGIIYLSTRSGTNSILISTLLAVLRAQIQNESGVPDDLADIITGASVHGIKVATLRVPVFRGDIQSPVNAYWSFGLLSSLNVQHEVPPPLSSPIDHHREVVALNPDNPATQEFMHSWIPYGVQASTHFLIVFSQLSPLPAFIRAIPMRSRHSRHSRPSRHSPVGYHTPSPLYSSSGSNEELSAFHNSSGASGMNSPASSGPFEAMDGGTLYDDIYTSEASETIDGGTLYGDVPIDSRELKTNSPPIHVFPSIQQIDGPAIPENPSSFHAESTDTSTSDINTICRNRGIPDDLVDRAKFVPSPKTLLDMVLNFRAMAQVLTRLGLLTSICTFSANKTADGLQAKWVVQQFGWSPITFKHKCSGYGWAEVMSKSYEWPRPVPSESWCYLMSCVCTTDLLSIIAGKGLTRRDQGQEILLRTHYESWEAIKRFWGPGGPVELGHYPTERTADAEDNPSDLSFPQNMKQFHITNHKASIILHIRKIKTGQEVTSNK